MAAARLCLALVTDIHHELQDARPKQCSAGLGLLKGFAELCASLEPDGIVDLGDRIDDRDRDGDLLRAREVAEVFLRMRAPRHHVMGNHDSYQVKRAEWESMLKAPVGSHSYDAGGVHLIFFSPDVDNQRGRHPYTAADEDIAWLAADLAGTSLQSIIFTHVPLIAGKMVNHYYFENREGRAEFLNSARIRDVIEGSGKTILVCSGHVHWNSLNISNGVYYVTVQSMTETFTTYPDVAGAYSVLSVGDDISLTVYGNDPLTLRLPIHPYRGRWLRP